MKNKVITSESMNYDYDCENDSLFIYSKKPYTYDISIEADNNVIIDLDSCGNPVAFEFLNASRVFKLDKSYFKSIDTINIHTVFGREAFELKVELGVLINNKKQVFCNSGVGILTA